MFYISITNEVPKTGGEYIEGIVGQPLYINPLLSQTNEADTSLSGLMYSSLLTYDGSGQLVNDLAESYQISSDNKEYTVNLRPNIFWHDGEALTADDVVFTIQAIQNPAYHSPLRQSWQGVDIRQGGDRTVVFTLKTPFFGFLNNLTVGILPKHLWSNILPENFSLAELNRQPVGSGPFSYDSTQKDSGGNIVTYKLTANSKYYKQIPYLSRVTFNFYPSSDAMLEAYNRREIMAMNNNTPEELDKIKIRKATTVYAVEIPRTFAVFFNQNKSVSLAHDEVREALWAATDRKALIDQVLEGHGEPVAAPLIPGYKLSDDASLGTVDIEKANSILDQAGWTRGEDGIRSKNGNRLTFTLASPDWPDLEKTGGILIEQWKAIGVDARTEIYSIADLQQNVIRPRDYDALLFGQDSSFQADPYPFWHSSQKKDPGLNLSLFQSDEADQVLDSARQEMDEGKRQQLYQQFHDIFMNERPALFLYSPYYLYPVNNKIKGIDLMKLSSPAFRLMDIYHWYVKVSREWKK